MVDLLNCATGTLEPYTGTWSKRQVMHLHRRMGFGLKPDQIQEALGKPPSQVVDELIDEALAMPLAPEPEWGYWTIDDYDDIITQRFEQINDWIVRWLRDMYNNGLREKLALFWHNHFVTSLVSYQCPSHMYQYHKLLQQYALGNFKALTTEMGKTPAMLVYLNGVENNRFSPNENYARELYELFTLGADNGYTQEDIEETARALTGWNGYFTACGSIDFLPTLFDGGQKTIFGQTGNWGYEEVHDILFAERAQQVAEHICGKLYRFFVHPETDEAIVAGLAQTFVNNNFELAPVLRQLFKSAHFFDEYVIGTQVKSPVEFFLSYFNDAGIPFDSDPVIQVVGFYIFDSGQQLFSPPDVAGWPGNRNWIDSNAITSRWQYGELFNGYVLNTFPELLRNLAKVLSNDANDPYLVAQSVLDHFLPNGMQDLMAYEEATDIFKEPVPQNYYDTGAWNLNWDTAPLQVFNLLNYLIRVPEFQLI